MGNNAREVTGCNIVNFDEAETARESQAPQAKLNVNGLDSDSNKQRQDTPNSNRRLCVVSIVDSLAGSQSRVRARCIHGSNVDI